MISDNKRREIERRRAQGWSTREIAAMTHVSRSTINDILREQRERAEAAREAAARGDLHRREKIEVGLDQVFFAMERIRAGREPEQVAVELGVPVVILRQLGEGVLMIPFKGKSLAIRLERGADLEGALARAFGLPEPERRSVRMTRERAAAAAHGRDGKESGPAHKERLLDLLDKALPPIGLIPPGDNNDASPPSQQRGRMPLRLVPGGRTS